MINGMMGFIAIGFLTLIGFIGAEFFAQHEAVSAGLQQCVVAVSDIRYEVVWQKDCPQMNVR